MDEEMAFKLILLGNERVGKTSIRRRFMGAHFIKPHLMILGADFSSKTVEIDIDGKDYLITYFIWDMEDGPEFLSKGDSIFLCVKDIGQGDRFHVI